MPKKPAAPGRAVDSRFGPIRVPPGIELAPRDSLIPDPRNSRTHSDAQVQEIAGSIRAFGFNDPIGVDPDGGIIEGHGRQLAAGYLDMPDVPVIRLPHMSGAEKRAYVIAHNRLAEHAGWDDEMLAAELVALRDGGIDIATVGFDDAELEKLLDKVADDADDGLIGGGEGDAEVDETASMWAVIIECDDETQQAALLERLQGEGLSVRAVVG